VSRDNGVTPEKITGIADWRNRSEFDEKERAALAYAERITLSDEDVDDELFEQLRKLFSPEQIIELTCTVAFENFLSKFHHALLVESQGFCSVSQV
jgi:alkylhydroperoxidase family enzyme